MIYREKIFGWLPQVEGASTRIGYIPCTLRSGGTGNFTGAPGQDPDDYTPMGVSGVTIGVGVDLGQQSVTELRELALSPSLLDKLEVYVGLTGRAAVIALYGQPLSITADQARALTQAVQNRYLETVVIPWFDRYCGESGAFAALPWQAQTVVYSLVYQCGPRGALRRGPKTILALSDHDWTHAAAYLCDAGGWNGEYLGRRKKEGQLLRTIGENE